MRILFLVHGMGVHGQTWAETARATLNDVAMRYPILEARRFDEEVRLVPVAYDAEFTHHLEAWDRSAEALDELARDQQIHLPFGLLNWLRGASETERNFFWSHVVDVVLYRFFPLVAIPVRLQVMQQIAATLADAMEGGTLVSASVMAHSLGTAVAHDALATLGSTPFEGSEAFMAGRFRFENIFMVANVGRILETTLRTYDSCVRPISAAGPAAYVARYYSFRHALDPFPVLRPFEPPEWGLDYVTPRAHLNHLYDFNVHGLEHYLVHPAAHLPIINGLFGRIVSRQLEREAIEAFPRIPPGHRCPAVLLDAETRFRALVDSVRASDDIVQVIVAGARFFAAVKEARDACI